MRIKEQFDQMKSLMSGWFLERKKNKWDKWNRWVGRNTPFLFFMSGAMFLFGFEYMALYTFLGWIAGEIMCGNLAKHHEKESDYLLGYREDILMWYTYNYINRIETQTKRIDSYNSLTKDPNNKGHALSEYFYIVEHKEHGEEVSLQHSQTHEKVYVGSSGYPKCVILDEYLFTHIWKISEGATTAIEAVNLLKEAITVEINKEFKLITDRQKYQLEKGWQAFIESEDYSIIQEKQDKVSVVDVVEIVSYYIASIDINYFEAVRIKLNRFRHELGITTQTIEQEIEKKKIEEDILGLSDTKAKYYEVMKDNPLNAFIEDSVKERVVG